MPMIPLTRALDMRIKQDIERPDTTGVTVRTYKGDRGFTVRYSGLSYEVLVDGFYDETYACADWKAVRKVLKKVIRREFPRSKTVRYNIE